MHFLLKSDPRGALGSIRPLTFLVTTLTKKMAESLTDYLKDVGIKVAYLHSEVKTLERLKII